MKAEQRRNEISVALQLRGLSLSNCVPLHTVLVQAPQKAEPVAKVPTLVLGVQGQENKREGARK